MEIVGDCDDIKRMRVLSLERVQPKRALFIYSPFNRHTCASICLQVSQLNIDRRLAEHRTRQA